jgi:hypothetical protein
MPTDYDCEYCNFHTQIKTNYNNHINSNKHLDIASKYITRCEYCTYIVDKLKIDEHYTSCKNKTIFDELILKRVAACKMNYETEHAIKIKKLEKRCSNTVTHKNRECKKEVNNIRSEYEKKIENIRSEHKKEIESVKEEYREHLNNYKKEFSTTNAIICDVKDKQIETVEKSKIFIADTKEKELARMETMMKTCGKITEKSVEGMMSALTYANKELADGPVLTKLCKFDFVEDEDGVNDLLHYNTENVIHEYIGDIIIGLYKKEKAIDQTLWNTDSARLVYIIRQKVDTKTLWEKDIDSARIKSFIITPIIKYFIECIDNVKRKSNKYIEKNKDCRKHSKTWNLIKEQEQMCTDLIHIKTTLLNPKLSKNIIKYITPKFLIGPQLLMAKVNK